MSNSIEFINKEIERMNNIIRVTQNDIALYTENKRDTSDLQVKLAVLENHLNSLQQVKADVASWYIINEAIEATKRLESRKRLEANKDEKN